MTETRSHTHTHTPDKHTRNPSDPSPPASLCWNKLAPLAPLPSLCCFSSVTASRRGEEREPGRMERARFDRLMRRTKPQMHHCEDRGELRFRRLADK